MHLGRIIASGSHTKNDTYLHFGPLGPQHMLHQIATKDDFLKWLQLVGTLLSAVPKSQQKGRCSFGILSPSIERIKMDLGEVEMFCREIELSDDEDGLVVRVGQVPEGDTGVVVWDAAIVLAKYLQTVQGQLQSRSVIGNNTLHTTLRLSLTVSSVDSFVS